MSKLLYLSNKVVTELVDPADVLRIAEETLRAHARDEIAWSTPRMLTLRDERLPALFRAKLVSITGEGIVGFRVTGTVRGLDSMSGPPTRMVLLSKGDTGEFLAMVDERWSYAIRTGAGAALAIKYLANPPVETIGMIGAGLMARGTVLALKAAVPLRRVVVTSRTQASREKLAAELAASSDLEVSAVDNPQEVLAQADASVVATTAKEPFIKDEWLRPGSTIFTMGQLQELETAAYLNTDKFVVDDWEQVLLKADMQMLTSQGLLDESRVHADMVQIVTGQKPGREHPDERIMIRSEGIATMDVSISYGLYKKALELGLGQEIEV
jgi:ornithine cyclodeaminase/alanine dehydrogenase-like protein (mu-crystallin family)